MTTYAPSATATPHPAPSRASHALHTTAVWTNRLIVATAVAQFYSAGLAIFGVAGFESHAIGGWLVQLLSLLTIVLLLGARAGFAISRLAMLILLLAVLQPVLAFAVRPTLPALSALHPVNGVAILAVAVLLERRLRARP